MNIITAKELKKRLDNNEVLLIDVREIVEYNVQSINEAYLIPLGEITVEKLPSTQKPIVIYCKAGVRSLSACKKLLTTNPHLEVYSLEGGILAWEEGGYKTKK
jgi:rhodanese-related sulfurtransferase